MQVFQVISYDTTQVSVNVLYVIGKGTSLFFSVAYCFSLLQML